jgi:hypothetical protein
MVEPSDRTRSEPDREDELAETLVAYLASHPHAADTLGGIAEWWLLRHEVQVAVERLARALRRLCARGIVEEVGTGPACRYRLRSTGQRTNP